MFFSGQKVAAALKKIVAEVGEKHVHAGYLLYVNEERTEPVCLLGHLYYELTGELVPIEYEGLNAGRLFEDMVPHQTLKRLNIAQAAQDEGLDWGTALEKYREYPNHTQWPLPYL